MVAVTSDDDRCDMTHPLSSLRPSTRPGRAAARCLVGFGVAFLAMLAASIAGQTGGDRLSDNWWLAAPALAAAGCALVGLPLALYAIVRYRERSLSVWLAVVVGAVAVFFLAGEVIAPH